MWDCSLTNTEQVAQRAIILPNGHSISSETVDAICSIIRLATHQSA